MPRRDNALVNGRGKNCSYIRSTTISALRTQTHVSRSVSRGHVARSQMNASQRSGRKRAYAQGNQDKRARVQFGEARSIFDRLGSNDG